MTTSAKKFLENIDNSGAEFVDFRFTDTNGTWHHVTYHAKALSEEMITKGITFDGSSIHGWRSIEDSDMIMIPDITSAVTDQLCEQPTLIVNCDIYDPHTNKPYDRDPRSTAKQAEKYLIKTGIADTAYFGPEPEFFIFDDIHFDVSPQSTFYSINHTEGINPKGLVYVQKDIQPYSQGHKPIRGGGYFPVQPVDSGFDLRSEIVTMLNLMGLESDKHHHEVAQAQHEIGFKYAGLTKTADNLQLFKYIVKNVAHLNGRTATFMPKPIYGDNGSGMHVHMSLWKDNKALFYGDKYNDLSDTALFFIGGILKHARTINAFTNPTTNSYKRLVPGFEAPVYKAYSARNRSVAVRIPHVTNNNAKRIEARFPDPAANSYLGLSAMLMAGIDGIQNKIHPGEAMDKNLFDPAELALGNHHVLCKSLQEALIELNNDREFLLAGDVFTNSQIDAYIALKEEEVIKFSQAPHPIEFQMYYST